MKTVFKALTLGMMLMAFAVVPAFAQEDECGTLYDTYLKNYRGSLEQRKTAVQAGEQYIAKCNTEPNKEQIDYLTKRVPDLKKRNENEEAINTFDASVKDPKNVNAESAFSSGRRILANDPNLVDVMLVLASIGFDKAVANPPVDTYNNEAINYAKQALQKLDSGVNSKQYGAWAYTYKTKENAQAWMNYTIAYIMSARQNQKKDALPYFYKAVQINNSDVKKNPIIYQAIGDFYKDEYNRIDDERTKVAEQAKNETNEETKKQLIDKTKELLALQKGYADRMIDAYARAYTLAPATDKAYKEALFNTLKVLYQFRNDGKTDGFNESYLSSFQSKPLPDPTSAVTPVVETTTTATTTSTTSSTVTTTAVPAMTTSTTAKSSTSRTTATPTAKPAANGTKTAPAKTTATPKKKGTR